MAEDIGLLLRGLGAAFSNQVPEFRQQMAMERENQYIQSQREQQAQMQRAEMMQARQRAMYQDAESALKLLAAGDLDSVVQLGRERIELLKNFPDADPSDTVRITQLAQLSRAGDRGAYQSLQRELLGAVQRGMSMGYITPPEQAGQVIPSSSVIDGQIVRQDASGRPYATPISGFTTPEKPDEQLESEQSEARTFIRQNVNNLDKALREATTSFNRITSLEAQMRSGNRSAINAGIMNLARLISPGVVTDRDAAAYSGAGTEITEVFNFLQGQGVDMDRILQIYDPANPQVFNVDNLMSVATTITASSLPSILSAYDDQRNIASQYNLSQRFVDSYLNQNSEAMREARAILGASPAPSSSQSYTFNSEEEAQAAIDTLPNGARVTVNTPSGTKTFVVSED